MDWLNLGVKNANGDFNIWQPKLCVVDLRHP